MTPFPRTRPTLIVTCLCAIATGCSRGDAPQDVAPMAETTSQPDTDVVIIGAGLSGLYAAMLLQDEGLSVKELEDRDRIG